MASQIKAGTLLEEFERLVRRHDLTYFYSDDRASYNRGRESLARIEAVARELPRKDAVRVWNAVVDERIAEQHRAGFYWKE